MGSEVKPIDPKRALRIIEGMMLRRDPESPILTPDPDSEDGYRDDRTEDEKLMTDIYVIAHAGGSHSCHKNHPSFADRALEIEKDLVDGRTIPAWKDPE